LSGDCFVMISGCSGGGKSTLLEELARRGHAVVREPGRRIIADVRAGTGGALPWEDPAAFSRHAIAMSVADHEAARGLTFFDRGVVDAAVALQATAGESATALVAGYRYDYLFLAPPWPDIYENDADRRHSLDKALSDYDRVASAYRAAGYDAVMLPQDTVVARADFVLETLELQRPTDE
jgi:predicted ATPase